MQPELLDALADEVALTLQAALAPILSDVKVLQSQIATWEARWGDLGALRERVAVVEAKSSSGQPEPTSIDELAPVLSRLAALEMREPTAGPAGPAGADGPIGPAGEKGIDGATGKDGAAGQDGADGRDGQPGVPGVPGRDGAPGMVGEKGQDGAPGRDGTLEGAGLEQIDERAWRLVRADGAPLSGVVKTPSVLDRGVYQAGRTYEKGDGVTFGGSFWIAQDVTSEKPGDGATKWRLAVKAGREGREGKPGKDGMSGPKGERGEPGRDYR